MFHIIILYITNNDSKILGKTLVHAHENKYDILCTNKFTFRLTTSFLDSENSPLKVQPGLYRVRKGLGNPK